MSLSKLLGVQGEQHTDLENSVNVEGYLIRLCKNQLVDTYNYCTH